jgi:hypothetical protein
MACFYGVRVEMGVNMNKSIQDLKRISLKIGFHMGNSRFVFILYEIHILFLFSS